MTNDAHTVRISALINALRALDPENIADLPEGDLSLAQPDVLADLNTATGNLITATYIMLGVGMVESVMPLSFRQTAESVVPRRLAQLTMTATRWVQTLVQCLGGIVVTDILADAVVAAATYQLALMAEGRTSPVLDAVMAQVLTKANSPQA